MPLLDEAREVLGVARGHLRRQHLFTEDLAADRVQQQARGGSRVGRLFFDHRARRQDRGLVNLVDRHAVVQVAPRLGQDRVGFDVGAKARAGRLDQPLQLGLVERHALAAIDHRQRRRRRLDVDLGLLGALLRATLAVEHVGARHFVVAAAHQTQLDLVLHVLDVKRAAARPRAQQRAHHRLGQPFDRLAHARRRRALRAVHREEGLHQRHRDLVRLEDDDRAVAADDLIALVGAGAGLGAVGDVCSERLCRRRADDDCLHEEELRFEGRALERRRRFT